MDESIITPCSVVQSAATDGQISEGVNVPFPSSSTPVMLPFAPAQASAIVLLSVLKSPF